MKNAILIALVLWITANLALGETRTVETPLYAGQGTELITSLPAGTEMTVIDTVGNFILVKVIGYIPLKAGTATSNASTIAKPTQSSSSDYSGRCTAITKKGTRCKRSAAAGSTRCWQHK